MVDAMNNVPVPQGCTYLNFTASHDGVGMRPVEGLVPKSELKEVFRALESFGGHSPTVAVLMGL